MTISQCCSGLCYLQHVQQAFFRQDATPSQNETLRRLKEVQDEQRSWGRAMIRSGSFKFGFRYSLGAFSKSSSLAKAIRRLVYIQVTYHYPEQSLSYAEATTPFQSSCSNDPTMSRERFAKYLQIHSGRGPAMSSPSRPCIGSSGTFSGS